MTPDRLVREIPKEVTINPFDYPREYFDVQAAFASRWSQITGESLAQSIYDHTALHRRIYTSRFAKVPSPEWPDLATRVSQAGQSPAVADLLWQEYISRPNSVYEPPVDKQDGRHFGSFAFDYQDKTHRIKVHFVNRTRGAKSDLAFEYLPQRRAEVRQMFAHIQQHHPNAAEVIGGSWLYNLEAYRRCWPSVFFENIRPVPREHISLRGDSVWGQFIRASGYGNIELAAEFKERVGRASSLDDLYTSFRYLPLQPLAPIAAFYRELGLVGNE